MKRVTVAKIKWSGYKAGYGYEVRINGKSFSVGRMTSSGRVPAIFARKKQAEQYAKFVSKKIHK